VEPESPESLAWAFHQTLLEVLRRLNQAAERRLEADGLEFPELERTIARSGGIRFVDGELRHAVRLLLDNGLIREELQPMYSWDRRRLLGERLTITPRGKSYLLRAIEDSGRIP